MSERKPPQLFSEDERKDILADAERLWKDLQENQLGGFSGGNRPFYILHEFKRIIEKYGNRDVGLTWSKNELDALTMSDIHREQLDRTRVKPGERETP